MHPPSALLIVTNAHVVEGATAIDVKVGGGATLPATVVGRDESTDLALLRGSGSAQAGNVGIGFAIPSETVRAFATRLGVQTQQLG